MTKLKSDFSSIQDFNILINLMVNPHNMFISLTGYSPVRIVLSGTYRSFTSSEDDHFLCKWSKQVHHHQVTPTTPTLLAVVPLENQIWTVSHVCRKQHWHCNMYVVNIIVATTSTTSRSMTAQIAVVPRCR